MNDYITLDEFKKNNQQEYQEFLTENPSIGSLKVEVFTAHKAIPIPDTEIQITKDFKNKTVLFFKGYTNSSGMIDNIKLNAPKTITTSTPCITPNYTLYNIIASHKEYVTVTNVVGMFGDTNVIQYIKLSPDVNLKGVDTFGS